MYSSILIRAITLIISSIASLPALIFRTVLLLSLLHICIASHTNTCSNCDFIHKTSSHLHSPLLTHRVSMTMPTHHMLQHTHCIRVNWVPCHGVYWAIMLNKAKCQTLSPPIFMFHFSIEYKQIRKLEEAEHYYLTWCIVYKVWHFQ